MLIILSNEIKSVTNAITRQVMLYNQGKNYTKRVFLTCKRVQKLLFFFEIEYMRRNEGRRFFREEFEAWDSGPVIPELYFRYEPIRPDMFQTEQSSEDDILKLVTLPCCRGITPAEQQVLDYILSMTMNMETFELCNVCKEVGSPWDLNYNLKDKEHRQVIPKSQMYSYYSTKDWEYDILKIKS